MAKIKKLRIGDPKIPRKLIDKMLEKYGVDYDYIMDNQKIEGKLWCSYYTWTQKESNEYKKWFIDFLQNDVSPRRSKKLLEREWQWFDMMYGLRIKDDDRL
jgi:hypothetical protein